MPAGADRTSGSSAHHNSSALTEPGPLICDIRDGVSAQGATISRRTAMTTSTRVHGLVAPGFEEVRAEFERNFSERGEIGAAVAASWRGEKVVDLWGGLRIPGGTAPWNEDTMVIVNSTTKGLAAMTLA